MSRRGTTRDSADALELFLDALSNAFGGILFIALLVCVKLQFSKAMPLVDLQEVERLESLRAELKSDVANLLEEHKNLTRQIKSMPKPDRPRLARYMTLVGEREILRQHGMNLQTKDRQLDIVMANLKRQKAAWNAKSLRLKGALRSARNELKKAKSEAMVIRLPLEHDTTKLPVKALLSGGRLRFANKWDGSGNRLKPNRSDIDISRRGKIWIITPKPGRGLVIEASESSQRAFERQMAQFDPDDRFLRLFVWSDSFSSFELVREWLRGKGFEHGVILLKVGEVLVLRPPDDRPDDRRHPGGPQGR